MSSKRSIFGIALLAGLFLAAGQRCASADEIVNVSVNTAAANAGPGQAELLFSLIDGSGAGDGNNTAMLSNLSFGSGASLDAALTSSNVTGTLGAGVSFSDTMFDSTVVPRAVTAGSISCPHKGISHLANHLVHARP